MYMIPLFLLAAGIVKAQDASQSQPIPTINVTYHNSASEFRYIQSCGPNNPFDCNGAWWTEYDPKYTGGSVRVANDPTQKFQNIEPYFSFSFKGTGFYIYQWINTTSAAQIRYFGMKSGAYVNFMNKNHWPYPVNEEATLTMTWSQTGLEYGWYTVGLQHSKLPDRQGFLVLDHIVIEKPEREPPAKQNNGKVIGGAVAGGIVGVLLIGLAFFFYRRARANAARAKARQDKFAGLEVDNNYVDPSSEIQASERLYSEAKKEEEMQMRQGKGKGKEQDPSDSLPDINELLKSV